MNKNLLLSLGLLTAVAATPAMATETWPNWYVGLSGGMTFVPDADIDGLYSGEMESDTGYSVGAALGYAPAISVPIRIEAEIAYHKNDMDAVSSGGVTSGVSRDITSVTYMANLYYDFRNASQWTPYVGAGVGAAQVNLDSDGGLGNTEDEDTVFAYQGMVGLSYAPEALPFTDWSLGYRYLGTDTPEFQAGASKVEVDYSVHSVEAGARFRF